MASREKRALDEEITRAEKAQVEAEAVLGQKLVSIKHAGFAVESAQERIKENYRNLRFMLKKGDVNLDDYRGLTSILENARGDHEKARAEVRRLQGEICHYNNVVSSAVRAIEVAKGKLAQFGRIILWRPRD